MALLGSLLLAMAVLALRLIIQSRILLSSDDKRKKRFAKQIEKLNYVLIIPVGAAMIIASFVWNSLRDSFLPVGVTLFIASITMLVQSQSSILKGDNAIKFGRQVTVWAWVCAGATVIALVAIIILLIRILFAINS